MNANVDSDVKTNVKVTSIASVRDALDVMAMQEATFLSNVSSTLADIRAPELSLPFSPSLSLDHFNKRTQFVSYSDSDCFFVLSGSVPPPSSCTLPPLLSFTLTTSFPFSPLSSITRLLLESTNSSRFRPLFFLRSMILRFSTFLLFFNRHRIRSICGIPKRTPCLMALTQPTTQFGSICGSTAETVTNGSKRCEASKAVSAREFSKRSSREWEP